MAADGIFYLEWEWGRREGGESGKTVRLDKKKQFLSNKWDLKSAANKEGKKPGENVAKRPAPHDLSFEKNGSSFKLLETKISFMFSRTASLYAFQLVSKTRLHSLWQNWGK